MKHVEFDHLTTQVDHLMNVIESLQMDNATLKQKIAVHIQERVHIQNQNERLLKQVKQVMKQMKEEPV